MLDNAVEKKTLSRTELLRKLELKVGENLRTFGLKKLSLHYLGKSVYASAMLLGVAWQSGKLPFTLDNMKDAFKKTMKKEELDNNLMAFTIGRYLIENGEESITPRNKLSEEEKVDIVRQSLKDSFECHLTKKSLRTLICLMILNIQGLGLISNSKDIPRISNLGRLI